MQTLNFILSLKLRRLWTQGTMKSFERSIVRSGYAAMTIRECEVADLLRNYIRKPADNGPGRKQILISGPCAPGDRPTDLGWPSCQVFVGDVREDAVNKNACLV